jgi:acyl carrier protein
MDNQDSILAKLHEIYQKRVKNTVQEPVVPGTQLSSLGFDSLSYSMIIADMEEEFNITIFGPDILKLKTVADVIAFVEKKQK